MSMTVQIARDWPGLRAAALESLEAWLSGEQCERSCAGKDGAARAKLVRSFEVPRTLPAGYYDRVEHLFALAVKDLPAQALSADQVSGLRVIEAARAEFEKRHPPCPHCGKPLENAGAFACWSCQKKVKG